jgi:hypothetical protein
MGILKLKIGHRRQSALPRACAMRRATARHISVRVPPHSRTAARRRPAPSFGSPRPKQPRDTLQHAPATTSAPAGPPAVPPTGDVLCSSAATRVALIPLPCIEAPLTHLPHVLATYKRQPSLHCARTPPVGPPLTPPQRTCSPVSSYRRPRLPSSSLHLTQARTAACSPALRRCSPDFEPRRPRRSHAAAARRSHLTPRHSRQSLPGDSNRTPVPHVDLPRQWIAAGELTPAGEGTVNHRAIVVSRGSSCKSL